MRRRLEAPAANSHNHVLQSVNLFSYTKYRK